MGIPSDTAILHDTETGCASSLHTKAIVLEYYQNCVIRSIDYFGTKWSVLSWPALSGRTGLRKSVSVRRTVEVRWLG